MQTNEAGMSKHTPPPWEVVPTGIACDGFHAVAEIRSGGAFVVAEVFHMKDAKIIADAPRLKEQNAELLEALRKIAGMDSVKDAWQIQNTAELAILDSEANAEVPGG